MLLKAVQAERLGKGDYFLYPFCEPCVVWHCILIWRIRLSQGRLLMTIENIGRSLGMANVTHEYMCFAMKCVCIEVT